MTDHALPSAADIAASHFDNSVPIITVAGYSALGDGGHGAWIADSTANAALAAAHPRACKVDAVGRYWRLQGDTITFCQLGASAASGFDNLPACRSTLAYAKAVGINKIRSGLPWGEIEWWAPTLSLANTYDPFDVDGPCGFLTISHDIDIDFEFCTINCKAYNGGSNLS